MAFASNYWHITASHVQRTAQQPKALSRSVASAENSPAPKPQVAVSEQPRPHQVWAMPSQPAPTQMRTFEGLNDQVVRMMQTSPNLTLEQVKAILKVGSFE